MTTIWVNESGTYFLFRDGLYTGAVLIQEHEGRYVWVTRLSDEYREIFPLYDNRHFEQLLDAKYCLEELAETIIVSRRA